MSERYSKGNKTLEEWLFDGSESDSEDDFSKAQFSFSEVARHDLQTSSSVPLGSVRPEDIFRCSDKNTGYSGKSKFNMIAVCCFLSVLYILYKIFFYIFT